MHQYSFRSPWGPTGLATLIFGGAGGGGASAVRTCQSSEHCHGRPQSDAPIFSTDRQNPLLFHRSWCRELTRFRALLLLLFVLFLSLAPVLGVSPPGFSPPGLSPPGLSPPGSLASWTLASSGTRASSRRASGSWVFGTRASGRRASGLWVFRRRAAWCAWVAGAPRPRLAASVDCRGGGDRLDRTN